MNKFDGFRNETVEFLVGISFNNNKEWFNERKEEYVKYVKEPITALSNEVYAKMREFNSKFNGTPRISRINRDIRFSKDKSPYKNSAWFYFNAEKTPSMQDNKPSYFFEIMPGGYRYGFAYCPQAASELVKMRLKMDTNVKKLEKLMKSFNSQNEFVLEGQKYKKNVCGENPQTLLDWYLRKELIFLKNCEYNEMFFSKSLPEEIFAKCKKLYPIYKFFYEI